MKEEKEKLMTETIKFEGEEKHTHVPENPTIPVVRSPPNCTHKERLRTCEHDTPIKFFTRERERKD